MKNNSANTVNKKKHRDFKPKHIFMVIIAAVFSFTLIIWGSIDFIKSVNHIKNQTLTLFIARDGPTYMQENAQNALKIKTYLEGVAAEIALKPSPNTSQSKQLIHSAINNSTISPPMTSLRLYDTYGREIFGSSPQNPPKDELAIALEGQSTVSYRVGNGQSVVAVPIKRDETVTGALIASFTMISEDTPFNDQYRKIFINSTYMAIKFVTAVAVLFYTLWWIMRKRYSGFQKKSEFHDALTKHLPGGIICRSLDNDFNIQYVTEGFLEIVGYTRDDLRLTFGECGLPIIYPRDRDQFVRTADAYRDRPGSRFEHQYRLIRQDSVVIWVLDKTQVERGQDGKMMLYSSLTDITAFKQEQKELGRMRREMDLQRECYTLACDLSDVLLFQYDIMTHELLCSVSLRERLSATSASEHFPDRAIKSGLIHKDDSGLLKGLYQLVLDGEEECCGSVRISDKAGYFHLGKILFHSVRDYTGDTFKIVGRLDTGSQKITPDLDYTDPSLTYQSISSSDPDSTTMAADSCPIVESLPSTDNAHNSVKQLLSENCNTDYTLIAIELRNLRAIADNWGRIFANLATEDAIHNIHTILEKYNDIQIIWQTGNIIWTLFKQTNSSPLDNYPSDTLSDICLGLQTLPVGDEGCDKLLFSVGAAHGQSSDIEAFLESAWFALEDADDNSWSLRQI